MSLIQSRFPASVDLTTLTTQTGFDISGNLPGSNLGYAVTYIDIDNNGYDDMAVSAPGSNMINVRFGGPRTNFINLALSSLAGFNIIGDIGNQDGWSLCECKFNGNAFSTLVIGSKTSTGAAIFVLPGNPDLRNSSSILLSSLNKIIGIPGYSGGYTVACGNLFGKGDNLVIGAPGISTVFVTTPASTINGTLSNLTLSNLGNAGFNITSKPGNNFGAALGILKDTLIDEDENDELIVGEYGDNGNRGATYLFRSSALNNLTSIALPNISNFTSIGCKIVGDLPSVQSGWSVSGLNTSILIGAIGDSNYAGATYEIPVTEDFCPVGIFPLASVNGNNGCKITGRIPNDQTGTVVADAGDFSWIGSSAIFIGGPGVNNGAGAGYIVFRPSGYCSSGIVSLFDINGINGLTLNGAAGSLTGSSASKRPGDLDRDGVPDVFFGGPGTPGTSLGSVTTVYGDKISALINKSLTIKKGQTVKLSTNNFDATYFTGLSQNYQIPFTISSTTHCVPALVNTPYIPISLLTLEQVSNNSTQITHDDSAIPPSLSIQLLGDNGLAYMPPQPVDITFIHQGARFLVNKINITQGETINISPLQINAENLDNPADSPSSIFYVIAVEEGDFLQNGSPVNTFTPSQIQQGDIQAVHYGSTKPFSYVIAVGDGTLTSLPQNGTVIFNLAPTLTISPINIEQRQSLILDSSMLNFTGVVGSSVVTVSNELNLHLELTTAANNIIPSFTVDQFKANQVKMFMADTTNPPTLALSVYNRVSTIAQFVPFNFKPAPILQTFQVNTLQGKNSSLSNAQILVTQGGIALGSLTIIVRDMVGGYIAFKNATQISVTSFYQSDKENLILITDGTTTIPSGFVSVSDGVITTPEQAFTFPFNAAPVININQLTIADKTLFLTGDNLSVTDENPDGVSLAIVDDQDISFLYPSGETKKFTYPQFREGLLQVKVTGPNPAYSIIATDQDFLTSPISSAIINYTPPSDSATNSMLNTGLITGGISGAVSMGYFAVRVGISRTLEKSFQAKIDTRIRHAGDDIKSYYRGFIAPVMRELMGGVVCGVGISKIKTTNFIGYRSEENTDAYLRAIEKIVVEVSKELSKEGVELFNNLSPDRKQDIVNEIVKQTKEALVPHRSKCSFSYAASFFKPDVSPRKMEENATRIANRVALGLKNPNPMGAYISPTQVADSGDTEMKEIKISESTKLLELRMNRIEENVGRLGNSLEIIEKNQNRFFTHVAANQANLEEGSSLLGPSTTQSTTGSTTRSNPIPKPPAKPNTTNTKYSFPVSSNRL